MFVDALFLFCITAAKSQDVPSAYGKRKLKKETKSLDLDNSQSIEVNESTSTWSNDDKTATIKRTSKSTSSKQQQVECDKNATSVKEETSTQQDKSKAKGGRSNRGIKATKPKKEKAEDDLKGNACKPELEIPEIIIPAKLEKIPRVDGPSPWNGTISYTNKVYLGAHISAAGNSLL